MEVHNDDAHFGIVDVNCTFNDVIIKERLFCLLLWLVLCMFENKRERLRGRGKGKERKRERENENEKERGGKREKE